MQNDLEIFFAEIKREVSILTFLSKKNKLNWRLEQWAQFPTGAKIICKYVLYNDIMNTLNAL